MSVWFITGASRGFGIEITRQALGRGDQVAATTRHPEAIPGAHCGPGRPEEPAGAHPTRRGLLHGRRAQKLARTACDQARWREISISNGYHA
jgi:NAD(P)-dependent dehydrogenase (short-subunit alcohol dehydrogenase family)